MGAGVRCGAKNLVRLSLRIMKGAGFVVEARYGKSEVN